MEENLKPGDRMVMTPYAMRNGLRRRGSICGELVRVVRSRTAPGGLLLKVRFDGTRTGTDFHPNFWRKLQPGETVDRATLQAEGERLREQAGMPPLPVRPALQPEPAPISKPEIGPETMVWAKPPGGRKFEITRRLCKLRDVQPGWEWEPREDD